MLSVALAFALIAAPAPDEPVARLVIVVGPGMTTHDYSTLEACEAARSKIIAYNRRRTDEELKRDKSDRVNHVAVAAACIPL